MPKFLELDEIYSEMLKDVDVAGLLAEVGNIAFGLADWGG